MIGAEDRAVGGEARLTSKAASLTAADILLLLAEDLPNHQVVFLIVKLLLCVTGGESEGILCVELVLLIVLLASFSKGLALVCMVH